ncbi:MAG: hypothetical protein A2731_03710 [Candidatus Buchananbacteria bacterium RIFCSPHIGHO2_01_FULL_39_8]|uniref:CARDB domain-containing protein n=1 Tax=Candidatus Buchananbacteria bacterium RIFCSPHIGHO2_01_FULL_39_8 TaxID=1797533 RepID=A0A1G1XWN5_9BACT|nr:MAG: hypothetical protein A2731_03710 [Candidatus Buchananbacteria bacterium RIFCSPHIGHO2_01_FULL_39_8]
MVRNQGNAKSNSCWISIEAGGLIGATAKSVSALNPGGQQTISWSLYATKSGTYTLSLKVDSQNQVLELSENNNSASRQISVR